VLNVSKHAGGVGYGATGRGKRERWANAINAIHGKGKCRACHGYQMTVPVLNNVYAVKVGDFQRVRIPPGQSVARPEATRAIEEVTNLLKYSGVTGHLG